MSIVITSSPFLVFSVLSGDGQNAARVLRPETGSPEVAAGDQPANGPILFLKSDRLEGSGWLTFAAALGLNHRMISDILAEIGCAGTPILFIDGIDRIRPDQKSIIIDILRAVEANDQLTNWKVLASSRDQGLEAYRAWFPPSFYRETGIGDVPITGFSDEEAKVLAKEKPNLKRLLFGPAGVREIARRPFFAAVLAKSFPDDAETPQTEVDLISAWWAHSRKRLRLFRTIYLTKSKSIAAVPPLQLP